MHGTREAISTDAADGCRRNGRTGKRGGILHISIFYVQNENLNAWGWEDKSKDTGGGKRDEGADMGWSNRGGRKGNAAEKETCARWEEAAV